MSNTALYCAIPNQDTTQEFGNNGHRGRDSVARVGTVAQAAGTGKVVAVRRDDRVYGYCVEVAYPVGTATIRVLLGHLSRIDVAVGQDVGLRTALGLTGGRRGAPGAGVSQDPHLHEGVWIDGVLTDPSAVLNPRETIPAGGGGTPITERTEGMRFFTVDGKKWVSTEVGSLQVADATADACFRVELSTTGVVASADLTIYNGVKAAINLESNKGVSAVTDNTAVLLALKALDTQADAYQTALLAAIAGVDEATLATFGLKRI